MSGFFASAEARARFIHHFCRVLDELKLTAAPFASTPHSHARLLGVEFGCIATRH